MDWTILVSEVWLTIYIMNLTYLCWLRGYISAQLSDGNIVLLINLLDTIFILSDDKKTSPLTNEIPCSSVLMRMAASVGCRPVCYFYHICILAVDESLMA